MNARALLIAAAAGLFAAAAFAAPPLASSWNITPSGSAASSGELLFRVTPGTGDSVEVTVPVHSGTNDVTVARNVRQALSAQLPRTYRIELGDGANVLISDPRGKPSFSIELVTSDVESLRVAVRNIEASASPTVPSQSMPATSQPPPTPAQSGAATPPTENPADAMPPAAAPPTSPNNTPAGGVTFPSAPPPNQNAPITPPSTPLPNPTPNGSPKAPPPNAPAGAPASAPPPG
jgi:hypothetical protein